MSVAVPPGYQVRPSTDGSGVELRPPQPSWGWPAVAFMMAWCLGWDTCLLASIGIGARMNWSGWPEDPIARWIVFFPLFWAPGIVATAMTLYQAAVRRQWILRRGSVAHRFAIPLLRLSWERKYDVAGMEILHASWATGKGATDTLRFLTRSPAGWSSSRVVLESRQSRVLPRDAIHADVIAIARFITERTGFAVSVIDSVIPEPSSGDA